MSFDPLTMTEKKRSATAVDLTGRFFGLTNRLKRTGERYWKKRGVFAALGAASFLLWAALLYSRSVMPGKPLWAVISLAGVCLLLMLAQVAVQIAIAAAAAFKISVGKALSVGLTRLFPWIKTAVAAFFITFLASLALLVPGFILKLRFSLMLPAMLSEQGRGIEPLAKSRDLVYGRTMAVLAGLLALSAPLLALGAVILLPLMRLSPLFADGFALPALGSAASRAILLSSPAALVMALLLPLLPTFLQIFYEDAVGDKESVRAGAKSMRRYKLMASAGAAAVVLLAAVIVGLPLIYARTRAVAVRTPANSEEETPSAPAAPPRSPEEERDWQRYRETNILRIALNSYLNENNVYPNKLEDLVPDFIPQMPLDPKTQQPYVYVHTATGYKLAFEMERGVMILAPGKHVLSPKGMDIPEEVAEPAAAPSAAAPSVRTDTDKDGLPDDEEIQMNTDPNQPDTDGDGINDGDEANVFETDPLKIDTDGDGMNDWDEIYGGFNPLVKGGKLTDSDGDGLADVYESYRRFNPNDPDMDGDGLADGDEVRVYGTDLTLTDTDRDGFQDAEELRGGFEPLGSGRLQRYRQLEIKKKTEKYGLHPPTTKTMAP